MARQQQLVVDMDMQWCIHTLHRPLHVPMCSLLSGMPILLNSVDSVLNFLDNTKFCAGNPDKDLVAVWYQQMLSLHGCSGNCDSSGLSRQKQSCCYPFVYNNTNNTPVITQHTKNINCTFQYTYDSK